MCKHFSTHYTLGMLYFVDDDACESILNKFISILSTLGEVDGFSKGGASPLSSTGFSAGLPALSLVDIDQRFILKKIG